MKLNVEKWLRAIRTAEKDIRDLKEKIRTPGHFPSWKEYRDLLNLKNTATCLYMVRAHLRNKLHMTKTVEWKGQADGTNIKVETPFGMEQQAHTFDAFKLEYVKFDDLEEALQGATALTEKIPA